LKDTKNWVGANLVQHERFERDLAKILKRTKATGLGSGVCYIYDEQDQPVLVFWNHVLPNESTEPGKEEILAATFIHVEDEDFVDFISAVKSLGDEALLEAPIPDCCNDCYDKEVQARNERQAARDLKKQDDDPVN